MISRIRRNPVAVLTSVYTVLAVVVGVIVDQHLLSDNVTAYLVGAVAILAAILGVLTRSKVTPLADPRDNQGRQLVAYKPGGPVR